MGVLGSWGVWVPLQDNPESLPLASPHHGSPSAPQSDTLQDYLCCCRFNQTAANGPTGPRGRQATGTLNKGKVHYTH